MALTTILGIVFGIALLLIVLCYAFCGIIAFIPYGLGLFGRILLFPITIIETYIYPVGALPLLVLTGFWAFIFISLLIKLYRSLGFKK